MLFQVGQTVITTHASQVLNMDAVQEAFFRYVNGDWGLVDKHDWKVNDKAVKNGERILAVYEDGDIKFWIITEWDRSVTTVLLPEDY